MKIMIVEDELELLNLYSDLLGEENELRLFSNPKDALDHYSTNSDYDYIIVDFQLPNINGGIVIEDIKKINAEQKIILVSALVHEIDLPPQYKVTTLAKPFQFMELMALLTPVKN